MIIKKWVSYNYYLNKKISIINPFIYHITVFFLKKEKKNV